MSDNKQENNSLNVVQTIVVTVVTGIIGRILTDVFKAANEEEAKKNEKK